MNKLISFILASIGIVFICGCDGSASQVKSGTLRQYPDVTVGAALDTCFYNTKWEVLTEKGRKIVRFTGKIKQEAHDNALKKTSIDETEFCKSYKTEEFKKRLAPYEGKLAAFYKANVKEYEDLRTAEYETKEKYKKLENEANQTANDYYAESAPQKKKMPDDPKRQKELLEKEFLVIQNKIEAYKNKLQQITNEKDNAELRIQKEIVDDFKKNSYWPVGSVVTFDFTVYPDGKKFDIADFFNDSWNEQKADLNFVLNVIFAK